MPGFSVSQPSAFHTCIPAGVLDMDVDGADECLAAGCADGTVVVYRQDRKEDQNQLEHAATLREHAGPVTTVRWLAAGDARLLASAGEDGVVVVSRERAGAFERTAAERAEAPVASLAASGDLLAVAFLDDRVRCFRVGSSGTLTRLFERAIDLPLSVAFAKVGARPVLAVGAFDGRIVLLDAESGVDVETISANRQTAVRALAAGSELVSGRQTLAAALDDRVVIYELGAEGARVAKEAAVAGAVSLRFGVTGRVVAAALGDGSVRVVDVL